MNDQALVHIVDNDETVRRSLDFLLSTAGYSTRQWTSGNDFLKHVDKSVPACVLLDVRMPGIDGLEVQKLMPEAGLEFPVIIITGHGDIAMAVQAMHNGATDFITKPFERELLLQSIDRAFEHIANRESLQERLHWALSQIGKLTDREREVLDGLACGYPNKTIAYDLGISARTVEVYRANIMSKMNVSNFAEALRIAFAGNLGCDEIWRETHGLSAKIPANSHATASHSS